MRAKDRQQDGTILAVPNLIILRWKLDLVTRGLF